MKKRILSAIAAAAILGGAMAGALWATQWRWIETTDDAYVEGDITTMAPKVAGIVMEVAVGDNQAVAAGEVLVRIDDTDTRAQVAEARALVAAREAALAQLDDRAAMQEAVIRQADAGISSAQAELTRTRQDLDRARALVRDDHLSRQRFDLQAAEAAKAAAGLKGTTAQLSAARHQLAALASERGVALAQVEQARALLAQAQSDLDATVIRAPVDGVIGNRTVRTGSYVRPGQHLLAVVPLATVWVDANFKETQIGRMQPGDRAAITVDAFPGIEIEGRVHSFAPASGARFSLLPPENATGNFTKVVQRVPVRISLPPDHALAGRLRPGLSVTARVDTRR